jgi:hypothetical protein
MLRTVLLPVGAAAILSAVACPALADPVPAAAPALTASSAAAIVGLQFVVIGDSGNDVAVSGNAPPAYNKKTIRSTFAKTTQILGGLTFKRSATSIQSIAAGHANATTGIAATASATVGSFRGTLSSRLGPLITVTTGKISSHSSFTQTKAGVPSVKGGTSLVSLKINAPALGINKTFSGTPKPNQVLFRNGDNSIIIYLNRQITTKVNNKVAALAVDAVDVQIRNFKIAGNTISGDITVAPTVAHRYRPVL